MEITLEVRALTCRLIVCFGGCFPSNILIIYFLCIDTTIKKTVCPKTSGQGQFNVIQCNLMLVTFRPGQGLSVPLHNGRPLLIIIVQLRHSFVSNVSAIYG